MGKIRAALAEASLAIIDHTISTIPDPALRAQLSAMVLAVFDILLQPEARSNM